MAMHIGSQGKKNDDNNAAQEEPDSPPPVLVFLNGASGGKKGLVVRRKIEPLIPSAHLFDLDEVGKGLWKPEDKLKQFQHLEGVKVLICGGDGTMGWILSCIDRLSPLPEHPNFAVGMMPLGTGNDLARSYGWGPGFSHRMLKAKFLEKVKKASAVLLDRWQLCVMPYKPLGDDKKIHDTHMPPTFTVHTYSSNFGGATFGPITDASEHGRTQSVLRMGRSFSTRMSSQAFAMQEEEADRSSRRGSFNTAGSRRGSFNLTGSRHGQGGEWKDEESAYERGGDTAKSMTRSSSAPPVMRYGGGGGSSGGSGSIGSFPSGSKGGLGSTMNALPTVGETVAENAGGGGGGAPTGAAEQEEAALVAAAAAAVEAAVSAASVASAASTEGDLVVESALASEEHEETKWAPAFARSSSGDSAVMPAPADAPVDAPADASVHALVDAPVVAPAGTRAADAAAEDAAAEDAAAEDAPSGAPAAGAPAAGAPAADVPSDAAAADATAASAIAADATAADATAADATAPGAIATDATAADVLAADTPAVDATDTPTADAADTPAADAADAADTPATDAADTPAAGARTEAPSDPQEKLAPLAPEGALQSRQEDDQVETGSDTAVTAAAVVVGIGDSDGGGGGGVGAATAEGAPKPPPQPPSSPPLQSPPGEKVEGGAGAEGNVFVAVGGGSMVDAGVAAAAASAAAASAAAARLAGETLEKREEVAPPERVRRTGPMPRATPSISVTQRYDSWESYDAVFCNYFSFGVDAVAALAFHEHRNQHPHLFTSRCRNQLWYARKGFPAAGGIPCSKVKPPASVGEYLELRVRRTRQGEWETIALKESLRGVVVLNLQSYGGGRNLWGKAAGCSKTQYAEPAPDDKILEIVGMGGIIELGCIMGFNNAGVRAQRLCQAAEVEIRVRSPTHMQIDGEPWLQAPAKICIKHYGQSTCLRGR